MDTADLTAAVRSLTVSVGELSRKSQTQQKVINELKRQRQDIRSTRIVLGVAVFGVLLDLVLTFGGMLLYSQVQANQREMQQVQQRTSSEVLCPLYKVFATSIKVNPPNPNLTEEQKQLRLDAADTILQGLDKMGCA